MKKLVAFGVCTVALAALSGAAQAQTIYDELGAGFVAFIDNNYDEGFASNFAINNAYLDGSVTVDQVNIGSGTTSLSTTALTATSEQTWDTLGTLRTQQLGSSSDTLTEVSTAQTITEVNLGAISTQVIGALNDGEIRIGQQGQSGSESFTESASLTDVVWAEGVASEAAYTENTGYADYSADFYASGSGDFSVDGSFAQSSYGPPADYFAANFAYNNVASLDGSISVTGNGMSAETMATTVAGAVNSGIIESGLAN